MDILPIASVPLKRPSTIKFAKKAYQSVKSQFGNAASSDFKKVLNDLEKRRNLICEKIRKSPAKSNVYQINDELSYIYFSKIHKSLMELFTNKDLAFDSMTFSWTDAFTGKTTKNKSTAFELASLIFNTAASMTNAATAEKFGDQASCTRAAKLLQTSAFLFNSIIERYLKGISGPISEDFVSENLVILREYCLAGAQECVVRNAVLKKMKKSSLGRLSMACCEMYEFLAKKMKFEWKGVKEILGFKAKFYKLQMYLFVASEKFENTEPGVALGYLDEGKRLIHEMKRTKGLDKKTKNVFLALAKEVFAKHKEVKEDNDKVYFEKVPEFKVLDVVKGYKLVKLKQPEEVKVDNLLQMVFQKKKH